MLPEAKSKSQSPLRLIAEKAEAFESSVISSTKDTLTVVVRLRRADGAIAPYTLAIDGAKQPVKVRELKPDRLPPACPDRHINLNGTFCTHWDKVQPLIVKDSDSAEHWWGQLLAYLRLQERVVNLRRWPSRTEWAHGDAALHQWHAEICAAALGLSEALKAGRLKVKKSRRKAFLSLMDGPRRIYSVWRDERRVATQRQFCFCGSEVPLIACRDHAARAAQLVYALQDWEREEKRFWTSLKGQKCCGTLDNCPLAETHAPVAA